MKCTSQAIAVQEGFSFFADPCSKSERVTCSSRVLELRHAVFPINKSSFPFFPAVTTKFELKC